MTVDGTIHGRPRRVLAAFNRYQSRGGEEIIFESEVKMLLERGINVVPISYIEDVPSSLAGRAGFAVRSIWSREWYRKFIALIGLTKPDVIHVFNTFPSFSPSIYYACAKLEIPVVQMVQNYRIGCARATLYRDGKVCEDCLGKTFPIDGIRHGCYHDSALQSAVVTGISTIHRVLGTWASKVDVYIAASEFSRSKLILCGLPSDKVVVKPNFISPDPGEKPGLGAYCLFVGRLSREKGVMTLLSALEKLDSKIPFKIVGDGPLANRVTDVVDKRPNVEWLGPRPHDEVLAFMRNARFLIFPSLWYEGQPMTLLEALACGLPVVCSRIGAGAEVISDRSTGRFFPPGDVDELARTIQNLWSDPTDGGRLGKNARQEYVTRYTEERNFEMLLGIYQQAMEAR